MGNNFKLMDVIVQQSVSNDWNEAKKEWYPFDFYYDNTCEVGCVCGKYPIKNICIIKHKDKETTMIVGNCCVTKFMNISISNKIFSCFTKLKKDITKSLNVDVIHHFKEINVMNNYEYKFYLDIKNKRKLSGKQELFKIKINQKFLNWVSIPSKTTS